jgi:chromosome segregation ATPase
MKDAELLKEENMDYSQRVLELETKSQEVSDQVKNEASIIKEDLEMKLHDAMLTVLKTRKHLEESMKEAELLKGENLEYSQKLIELDEKYSVSESEKKKLYTQMILEVSNKSGECERHRKEKEATEKSLACLKQEKDAVELSLASTVAELMGLKESLKSQEEVNLKEEANLKEVNKLKKQFAEHHHKLSEQEAENKDLKKRIYSLEEELEHKRNSLVLSEKKLRDKEASGSPVSLIARSLSRASSKVGPLSNFPPTREAIELADAQQKVKLLEVNIYVILS